MLDFLVEQSFPFRGDGDEFGKNICNCKLRLHGEDDSRVLDCMKRKTNNNTSPKMKNESK